MTDAELRRAIVKELRELLSGHENEGMLLTPMQRDLWRSALSHLHRGHLRLSGCALDTIWEVGNHPEKFDPAWLDMKEDLVVDVTVPNMRQAFESVARLSWRDINFQIALPSFWRSMNSVLPA